MMIVSFMALNRICTSTHDTVNPLRGPRLKPKYGQTLKLLR